MREAGDLANAIFDKRARMVAQAVTGTPGHINSLGAAAQNLLKAIPPETLVPGDVLITNDPWMSAGHFFDITILTPIFRGLEIIGYCGSTIHHTDIGGYGVGSGARDIHEEGLWIPVLKLYEGGRPNETLHAILRQNVVETAVADVVGPAVAADQPHAAANEEVGERAEVGHLVRGVVGDRGERLRDPLALGDEVAFRHLPRRQDRRDQMLADVRRKAL